MGGVTEAPVTIGVDGLQLVGDLEMPPEAKGVVVFAHGSGSGRFSPRNRSVATALQNRELGTLLFDLLTEEEERIDMRTAELRFDIALLAGRVIAGVDWLAERESLPIGAFGASTGAAAALMAGAERPERVAAIVSRGGRPDLAGDALPLVSAPTLLIVGEDDHAVIEMNREAAGRMTAETTMEIVEGAGHLFEEPGALEKVADLAGDWFTRFLDHPGSP